MTGPNAVEIEPVYNIFLYEDDDKLIRTIGIFTHWLAGSDVEKLEILCSQVNYDYVAAERIRLPKAISWQEYCARWRLGTQHEVLEPALELVSASKNPLQVVTPVIGGQPRVDGRAGTGPLGPDPDPTGLSDEPFVDYLRAYKTERGFDVPRLLDDDYVGAIRLLFNERKYASASKLLMSFIDTLAFVEYGDDGGGATFRRWLESFADLSQLGITPEELWEFRNGLIHMTSLESRKVAKGTVPSLIPFVAGGSLPEVAMDKARYKLLDLKGLLKEIGRAIEAWLRTYNEEPDKFAAFVSRYDLIVSDSRLSVARLDPN